MRALSFGKKFAAIQQTDKSYYYIYNSSVSCTAEFSPQEATLEHFFSFLSTLIPFYDFNFHFL